MILQYVTPALTGIVAIVSQVYNSALYCEMNVVPETSLYLILKYFVETHVSNALRGILLQKSRHDFIKSLDLNSIC